MASFHINGREVRRAASQRLHFDGLLTREIIDQFGLLQSPICRAMWGNKGAVALRTTSKATCSNVA